MVTPPPGLEAAPQGAWLSWTILFAPLAAGAAILLTGLNRRRFASTLAIAGLLASFGCTLRLFALALKRPDLLPIQTAVSWINLPGFTIQFGVLIDQLSLLMALVVTGVGSAIFIYSTAYMHDDEGYSRFFGVLSLFAFAMLTIVLATNWVQLFMGWELVGFSSYLLIGHWYAKPAAADAGKKAFMVNRVADFGFLLGILALWAASGIGGAERTFDFLALEHRLTDPAHAAELPLAALPLIGLLIFCGPMGKSAQFPLHVWLPDAMEGPTPVSALIHAATMVAAGVYLLCRAFWLFEGLPQVLTAIMWVGGITACFAACLALVENDLKRILAYSTLSQLGYMVMAVGLGGAVAGMYHLTTHAFFKALLFLGAGSVIHGTHEQDIRKLGGLWRSMRWTSATFLVGALALCGFPGLSGFFSKDEILVLAHENNARLYWLGTVTAGMTAFYAARLWFTAFTGKPHGHAGHGHSGSQHAHESPPAMVIPLVVLAALAIAAGYIGIPHFLAEMPQFHGEEPGTLHWDVAATSLAAVASGLGLAWLVYQQRAVSARQLVNALAVPHTLLERRFYIDEMYAWVVANVQQRMIAGFCAWFERVIIIGLAVNGIAWLTAGIGRTLRLAQTGKVQTYVLAFLLGIVWLLAAASRQ